MSKDEEIRAIRVIPFSGKTEDFNMWKMKFLSRAKNHGFKDVLTGTTTIPKESETLDENYPKDEPKIQARKMNEIAMEELLCSVSDPVSHGALKCHVPKTSQMETPARLGKKCNHDLNQKQIRQN